MQNWKTKIETLVTSKTKSGSFNQKQNNKSYFSNRKKTISNCINKIAVHFLAAFDLGTVVSFFPKAGLKPTIDSARRDKRITNSVTRALIILRRMLFDRIFVENMLR